MSNFIIAVGHTASGNKGCGVVEDLMKVIVLDNWSFGCGIFTGKRAWC